MHFKSLAATAAIALLGFAAPSWASMITHSFDVVVSGQAGANGTYSGTFSYDSNIIPINLPGTVSQTGLLTASSFTVLGINFDGQANTGYLGFDAQGHLNSVLFGTNCSAGTCTAPDNKWYFSWSSAGNNGTAFLGNSIGNYGGEFTVATSVSEGRTVPEPGTLALVGLGLAGLGIGRRRKGH